MLLVSPGDPLKLYDLDNLICLPENKSEQKLSKLVIGFISDVVGPVSMPFYCVAIYEKFVKRLEELGISDLKEFFQGRQVSLVNKSLKTINA